jgi:hypothetical protein
MNVGSTGEVAARAKALAYQSVGIGFVGIDSALKSLTILLRGVYAAQYAWHGFACMTLQESGAATRAIIAAPNVWEQLRIERDGVRHALGRCVSRGVLLSLIGIQAVEDAAEPLWRSAFRVVDRVSPGTAP